MHGCEFFHYYIIIIVVASFPGLSPSPERPGNEANIVVPPSIPHRLWCECVYITSTRQCPSTTAYSYTTVSGAAPSHPYCGGSAGPHTQQTGDVPRPLSGSRAGCHRERVLPLQAAQVGKLVLSCDVLKL